MEGRNAQKIIRLTTPTPFPHQVVKRIRFRTLFPYKNFVTRKAWSFQPQTLGAGFGRNSGTRAPTPSAFILFRPPSRQRAKLAMLFYRAAAAALAPSSWRATMPRNFFGHEHSSSSRLSPLEAPTPPDRVGISDDLPDWCPTGSSTLVLSARRPGTPNVILIAATLFFFKKMQP